MKIEVIIPIDIQHIVLCFLVCRIYFCGRDSTRSLSLPISLSLSPSLSYYLSLSLAISVIPACAEAWKIRVQCQLQANDSTESYVGATRRMINENSRIHIHAHTQALTRTQSAKSARSRL